MRFIQAQRPCRRQAACRAAQLARKPLNEAFLKTAYVAMGKFAGELTGKPLSGAEVEAAIRAKGVLLLKSATEVVALTNLGVTAVNTSSSAGTGFTNFSSSMPGDCMMR